MRSGTSEPISLRDWSRKNDGFEIRVYFGICGSRFEYWTRGHVQFTDGAGRELR